MPVGKSFRSEFTAERVNGVFHTNLKSIKKENINDHFIKYISEIKIRMGKYVNKNFKRKFFSTTCSTIFFSLEPIVGMFKSFFNRRKCKYRQNEIIVTVTFVTFRKS